MDKIALTLATVPFASTGLLWAGSLLGRRLCRRDHRRAAASLRRRRTPFGARREAVGA